MKNFCGLKNLLKLSSYSIINDGELDYVYNKFVNILRPNNIICITGLSGSGKSTIVSHLSRLYDIPIYYFGKNVTKLCNNRGYKKSREFIENNGIECYKNMIYNNIYDSIMDFGKDNHTFIIDGIFSIDIFNKLKEHNNVYNIYVELDEETRIARLSGREHLDLMKAKNEIMKKDIILK